MMSKLFQPRSLALASIAAVGWLLFALECRDPDLGPRHDPATLAAFPAQAQFERRADPDQVGAISPSADGLRRTLAEPAPLGPARESVDCRHIPGCNPLLLAEARDRLKRMLDAKETQQRDKAEHDKDVGRDCLGPAQRRGPQAASGSVGRGDRGPQDRGGRGRQQTADLKACLASVRASATRPKRLP